MHAIAHAERAIYEIRLEYERLSKKHFQAQTQLGKKDKQIARLTSEVEYARKQGKLPPEEPPKKKKKFSLLKRFFNGGSVCQRP